MPPLTSALRQAGAAAGFGGPPPAFKLLKWTARPNAARTVLGFIAVEMPSGLQILDLRFGIDPKGKRHILPPAEQQCDRSGNLVLDECGKPRWFPHLGFRGDRIRQLFQDQVLAALRARHPELFAGEATS